MVIRLFANFRDLCGNDAVSVNPDTPTVRGALWALIQQYPAMRPAIFEDDGETLKPLVHILINGQNILFKNGLDTEVHENDSFALFPPVAGGM